MEGESILGVGKVLRITDQDDVAIALEDLATGDIVEFADIRVREPIRRGHKVALRDLSSGAPVRKYGYEIGRATRGIGMGEWVHTHNLRTGLQDKVAYRYEPDEADTLRDWPLMPGEFLGFRREDGSVGIRNEIWILNTVGCINKVAEQLAAHANARFAGQGIDGVYHFAHPYGCSQLGDDLLYTQRCLAALARHPNAGGVLVLGLGCENNRIDAFATVLGEVPPERVRFLAVQDVDDEMAVGLAVIEDLVAYAQRFRREPVPVSALRVGLKCGGSDGFSGISANPLVGDLADLLVQNKATALLTEVPEMFGAETILMRRACDEQTFGEIVSLIDGFKDYYVRHGQVIYENPSPGNKDGGITTLEEKSLGCIQKGGRSAVVGVLDYGQAVARPGLHLVQAPGNDMVSVTALVAAGAQIVLFTTGRGTPLGGAVPTVKISSNSELARHKPRWIDFDAGPMLTGAKRGDLLEGLYRFVIEVASGAKVTCNEANAYREIAIFKDGVTL